MSTQTHAYAEPPRWGSACPDHNLQGPLGPRQHPQTLSSLPQWQRRGPPHSPGGLQKWGWGNCEWHGRCPGSLRRGGTGSADRQMGRKCSPASRPERRGTRQCPRSQPHPKANSPSCAAAPPQPVLRLASLCRDPRRLTGGRPGPRLLGVLAASTAAAALYLAQETQAPLFHLDGASRRFAMETEARLGTWGPCRAWWCGGA